MRKKRPIPVENTDKKEQSWTPSRGEKCGVKAVQGVDSPTELVQNLPKNRPRGRPWPQGVSGNPAGRPKGARNKLTLAMLAGVRQAEAKLAQPRILNQEKPFEVDGNYCLQEGVWFAWDSILKDYVALPDQYPPPPPARFDPGARRTEMTWHGRPIYVQPGWPFDPETWRRLRL